MKKRVFLLLCGCIVFLFFSACDKSNNKSNSTTSSKAAGPIIITDLADFEFTSGHDVPGTIFQTNMLWSSQSGKVIYATVDGKLSSLVQFHDAPQRYDFQEGDSVTIIFKVGKFKVKEIISITAR